MAEAPLNPDLFPVLRPDITPAELRALSYYQLLGVSHSSPLPEIQTNYDLLSLYCHPFVCRLPLQEARFNLLAEAYATLSDATRRATYNSTQQRTAVAPAQEHQLFAQTEQRWGEWAQHLAAPRAAERAMHVRALHGPSGVGWLATGALSGAVFGATIGGPVGAVVGASVGAVGGLWRAATGTHMVGSLQQALNTPQSQALIKDGVTAVLSAIEESRAGQGRAIPDTLPQALNSEEELQAVPCSTAEDGRQDVCKICQEHVINVLLLPCRHIAICSACTVAVLRADRKCPICRAPIQQVQAPVYIS